jgi:DNA-nicking Smr family endonuclease
VTGLPEDEDRDDDAEDARLFREAVRGVRPLRTHTPEPRPAKPRPRARFARADRAAVLRESLDPHGTDAEQLTGEALAFHRPQIPAAVLRRLRRGNYHVQRDIDLHGMTVAEAKVALRGFLANALEQNVRCVRIVHGKGLRSGHRGPVLKAAVSTLLRRTAAVLAYVSARPCDGGTGALYVLLSSG